MDNIVFKVAYEGTNYLGWQKTNFDSVHPSIEYMLESTLSMMLQQKVDLQAASRTDRGVHAEAQIVNFSCEKEVDISRLELSLNKLLPPDIRILSTSIEDPSFHATVDAKAKEYIYRIYTAKVLLPFLRYNHWHIPMPLNLENMRMAADTLIGEHDFIAFRNHRKGFDYNDTVREVYSIHFDTTKEDVLEIKVKANKFLYKMCRNIIGTLVYVGLGKLSPGQVAKLTHGGSRPEAGITAPAHGLALEKVFYSTINKLNATFLS